MNVFGLVIDGRWLWVAAALLYLVDTVRRVRGTQVILRVTGARIAAFATSGQFGVGGARFYLPRPLPGLEIIMLAGTAGAEGAADAAAFRQRVRGLRAFRVLSASVFVLGFVVLPLLSARLTLGVALLLVLPPLYALNAVQSALVVRRAGRIGIARPWQLVSDIMLCPPYGANLAGRLAARWQPAGDPVRLAHALDPAGTRREIIAPLLDDPDLAPGIAARYQALIAGAGTGHVD